MLPEKGVKGCVPGKSRHYSTGSGSPEIETEPVAGEAVPSSGLASRRLKVQRLAVLRAPRRQLLRCPVTVITLESGETVKKGCGRRGLAPFEAGYKCFYCGNVQYAATPSLDELWFHFRLGREYWRVQSAGGREYVNGVPVRGVGDALPAECVRDLTDPRPPEWFRFYVQCDENQFNQYLQTRQSH